MENPTGINENHDIVRRRFFVLLSLIGVCLARVRPCHVALLACRAQPRGRPTLRAQPSDLTPPSPRRRRAAVPHTVGHRDGWGVLPSVVAARAALSVDGLNSPVVCFSRRARGPGESLKQHVQAQRVVGHAVGRNNTTPYARREGGAKDVA